MGSKHRIVVTVVVLVITAGLCAGGVTALRWVEVQRAEQQSVEPPTAGVDVEVAAARMRLVGHEVSSRGFLAADEQLVISSEVAGRIDGQFVEASDRVEKGGVLFEIDRALREMAVEKAKADVARMRSDLHEAQVHWQRVARLEETDSAPPIEVLEVQSAVERSKAMVRAAEVALSEAELVLDKTTIRSPVSGVVAGVLARQGEFASIGHPLAEVIVTDRVRLTVQLNDREVVSIGPGDTVEVSVSALPGEVFAGEILRIFPRATLDSRKFEVEIGISNPDGRLRPGFFAEARITPGRGSSEGGEGVREILTIPRLAVQELHRQEYCFVVVRRAGESVDRARWTLIETLPILTDPQSVQVVSGLEAGERVITLGHLHVTHDTVVRVVE